MAERNRTQFGDKPPRRLSRKPQAAEMFPDGEDLPIFSGTPQEAIERPYVPEDHSFRQTVLPGMPGIDYDRVLERDKAQRRRRSYDAAPEQAVIELDKQVQQDEQPPDDERQAALHEALARYNIGIAQLREIAAHYGDLNELLRTGEAPEAVHHLINALSALLRPGPREQIKSPADLAAVLMVTYGTASQETLGVVCLDTKNRIQDIVEVYKGSLNTSVVRVAEILRPAIRWNSAAFALYHNHPSADPNPSPEDVLVTREVVTAAKLHDIDPIDHLVIGQGKWVSLRQRGLGFSE